MKINLLVGIIAAIAPASLMASVHSAYYTADFATGSLPSSLKAENVNSLLPVEKYYQQGYTASGWTVSNVASKYAAISPTHTLSEDASCNRLSTPAIKIESGEAILRWSARSLISECKESYRVLVSEEGKNEWESIFSVEEEDSEWIYHIVSLEPYEGKTLKIAFECNSTNKYMLALTDIFIGVAGDDKFFSKDTTIKFPAYEEATVSGSFLNLGRHYSDAAIQVRIGDIVMGGDIIGEIKTGEEYKFSFPVDVIKNEKNNFSVEIVDEDGNPTILYSGIIYPSDFARNQMIDEGTGMWCNNCPKAVVQLEDLRIQYPDQIVTVATHANDKFAEKDYWADIKFYAIPYFKANRQNGTSDIKRLTESFYLPTTSQIEITKCEISEDNNTIEVAVGTLFSEEIQNAEDKIRIGYIVTGDFHSDSQESGIYQENGILMPSGEQYYFLPTIIPADLVWLHDVTLTSATAFTGFPESLPKELKKTDSPALYSFDIPLNDLMKEADKLNVVAFIIDTDSGIILNSAEIEAVNKNLVKDIIDDLDIDIKVYFDRVVVTSKSDDASLKATLLGLDGSIVRSSLGDGKNGVSLSLGRDYSIYLLKIEKNGKTFVKKIIR